MSSPVAEGRIPALDGIRGLAICMVLLWHAVFATFGAQPRPTHFGTLAPFATVLARLGMATWSGVDLFFVLSGFLIGGILLDAIGSRTYFRTFYIRRAHRILPLYAAVLAIAFIVDRHYRGVPRPVWASPELSSVYYLTFLQNFWMAAHGSLGSPLLAVTWSLAIEEQFYLTLPLLIAVLSRRTLWRLMVAGIFVAPLLRMLALHYLSGGGVTSYVLTPFRADALGLGVIAALATRTPAVWNKIVAGRLYVFAGLGLSCMAVLGMLMSRQQMIVPAKQGTLFGLQYSLLGCLYFFLLLSVLLSPAAASLFSLRPLRFMGVIAYGVYLLHLPLIELFRELGIYHPASRGVTTLASSVVAVAVSIALAFLSWKYFEKPLVNRGHRWRYLWPPAANRPVA